MKTYLQVLSKKWY